MKKFLLLLICFIAGCSYKVTLLKPNGDIQKGFIVDSVGYNITSKWGGQTELSIGLKRYIAPVGWYWEVERNSK